MSTKKPSKIRPSRSKTSKSVPRGTPSQVVELEAIKGVTFFETGVAFERQLTYTDFESLYNGLLTKLEESEHTETSVLWQIGDTVKYGEDKIGEDHAQAIDPLHYKSETVRGAVWVCSRVPVKNRHPSVPFGGYKYIAKLDPKKQKDVVQKAADEKLTVAKIKKLVQELSGKQKRKAKKATDAPPVVMVDITGKYLTTVKELLEAMPVEKWAEESLETVKTTFDSMVLEVRSAFGWEKTRGRLEETADMPPTEEA